MEQVQKQISKKNKIPETSPVLKNYIPAELYRKGPAKIHVFGKANYDSFHIRHLKNKDYDKIKLMFADKIQEAREEGYDDIYELISYSELYNYIDQKVKSDDDILIGDIIYEANEYESRPEYGFHIVSYDPEKKYKIYRFHEGMPHITDIEQIKQLKKNNVTYDNISEYRRKLPNFECWEGFYYSWVEDGIYSKLK